MIQTHVPFAARYVDYGKVFVPNGALDFSTLAFSDPEIEPYGPQLFNRGLVFPEGSEFAARIGSISAALLMFEGGYLFTLVQRRREGELSSDPRTDRPFNQVRFVILTREMIEQAFAARAGLYTGLAQGARHPDAKVWLKDYTAGGQLLPWNPQLERIEAEAPSTEAVRFVTNALLSAAQREPTKAGGNGPARQPQPISIPLPGTDFMEKLRLVEAAQYWLLPRLGVFSFALDYVSVQNVHLRLFGLPPDAPAPLPADRIFLPGPGAGRFEDDYHSAVEALEHEALYDPALAGLLDLKTSSAEAVALYRVEKQAQPLAGTAAARLYPEVARLGTRRFGFLRRVPREDKLALLRQADLPADLRLDLLQTAFDGENGLLWLYAPFHLAVPRAARDDDRIRALLRAALAKSPETALGLIAPDDQAELYRDLLLARQTAPRTLTGPETPEAEAGQPPLLETLLQQRSPQLSLAMKAAAALDPALFGDALGVLEAARDLPGLLWLWQSGGQGDFKRYTALLERAVQPAWYGELARSPGAWRELLAEGRALVTDPSQPESANAGSLLHALPRDLVPFIWQASRHAAEHDGGFGEWWLFNEAVALPEQLPNLWQALEQLPAGALLGAGPALNFLLGRGTGLSLLRACTPPGYTEPNEALFGTVITAWQAAGFRSLHGDLRLAAEDIRILLGHLPGSNELLAAIALSPIQTQAIHGLSAEQALQWARGTGGPLRAQYRTGGRDALFAHLIDLPAMDEALLRHLLVEDDATATEHMEWAAYAALAVQARDRLDSLSPATTAGLAAYLEAAAAVQNRELAETFRQSQIDIRAVLVLLTEADAAERAADEVLPLAGFHLQETNPALRDRAAELLRGALERTDSPLHLGSLPDSVLEYLKANFCEGHPLREAAGHWIEAELLRRSNAYKLEALLKPPPRPRSASPRVVEEPVTLAEAALAAPGARPPAAAGRLPKRVPQLRGTSTPAAPAPPPPPPPAVSDGAEEAAAMQPLLGELALPSAAPKKPDTAVWLWVAIIVIVLAMCGVLVGALWYIQSLQAAAGLAPALPAAWLGTS